MTTSRARQSGDNDTPARSEAPIVPNFKQPLPVEFLSELSFLRGIEWKRRERARSFLGRFEARATGSIGSIVRESRRDWESLFVRYALPDDPNTVGCSLFGRSYDPKSETPKGAIEIGLAPVLKPPTLAIALGFPIGSGAFLYGEVEPSTGDKDPRDLADGSLKFFGLQMKQTGVRPDSRNRSVAKRNGEHIPEHSRIWIFELARFQHSDRSIKAHGMKSKPAEVDRVATGSRPKVENPGLRG